MRGCGAVVISVTSRSNGSASSDAIVGYNETYTLDNPATPAVEVNSWGLPGGVGGGLLSPRFARLQVQFDF
jgi:hypothetical protein